MATSRRPSLVAALSMSALAAAAAVAHWRPPPPPFPYAATAFPPPPPGAVTATTLSADGRAFANPFSTFPGLPRPRRFLTLLSTRAWYAAAAASVGVGPAAAAAVAAVASAAPVQRLTVAGLTPPPAGVGRITWLGHGSSLLQAGGATVLVDPVFGQTVGPAWAPAPVRLQGLPFDDVAGLAAALAAAAVGPVTVAITHGHHDHADERSVAALADALPDARWVVPLGLAAWLRHTAPAVPPAAVTEVAWWSSLPLATAASAAGDGRGGGGGGESPPPPPRLTFVPAQHWSRRSLTDVCQSLWGGYVLSAPRVTLYAVGDSGDCPVWAEVAAALGPIHGVAVPIGATHPRPLMRAQHMDAAEAVALAATVGAKVGVAVHWGTFILTTEGVLQPLEALAAANARAPGGGVVFAASVGEPVEVVGEPPEGAAVETKDGGGGGGGAAP